MPVPVPVRPVPVRATLVTQHELHTKGEHEQISMRSTRSRFRGCNRLVLGFVSLILLSSSPLVPLVPLVPLALLSPGTKCLARDSAHHLTRLMNSQGVEFCARPALPQENAPLHPNCAPEASDLSHLEILGATWSGLDPVTELGHSIRSSCSNTSSSVELGELPIFPISAVLLPGSEMPFQIFPHKPEIQEMFGSIKNRGLCGIVLADYDALNGSFARVGCAAEVADATLLDDGRLIVETVGMRRFRILHVAQVCLRLGGAEGGGGVCGGTWQARGVLIGRPTAPSPRGVRKGRHPRLLRGHPQTPSRRQGAARASGGMAGGNRRVERFTHCCAMRPVL